MKVLITAGSGFLGSHLAARLRSQGHDVVTTARRPRTGQLRFVLGEEPPSVAGFDAIIHTAHDFESSQRTIDGTRRLFEAARQSTPRPRQLFISSYSARPDALSEYGQVKYSLEQLFIETGDVVMRPGLVIGNGGLFGRTLRLIMTSPVIPLIDGGHDEVPVLSLGDAIRCVTLLLESGSTGAWNLFHPDIPSMRRIVETIAQVAGRHPVVIPVPAIVAMGGVRLLSRLGVRLPFREDNMRALRANRVRIHVSDLARLGLIPASLAEAVAVAIENARSSQFDTPDTAGRGSPL